MTAAALPAAWRDRAAELRRFGAEPQAITLEAAAEELDAALRDEADAELTLTDAAAESGYSTRRLRELIAAGEIVNRGRRGAPRIRRGDLPRRASRSRTAYDPAADAAALIGRGA